MSKPPKRIYECSRQVESTITIPADSLKDLLLKLPSSADDLVETADGVAFSSNWTIIEVTEDREKPPETFEVSDVDVEMALDGVAAKAVLGE